MINDIGLRALHFATIKHHGQIRKYTGAPYVSHCFAVAMQVLDWDGTEEMQAAAFLHDTLEDTKTTYAELLEQFGPAVANLVLELTDAYTAATHPHQNRAWRKKLEADRLWGCSLEARVIKLADMADNTSSIVKYDPSFAAVYLKEKAYVLERIGSSLDQWKERLEGGQ